MAMIGGTSEVKVADEEVQKICDEVCSTFFSIGAVYVTLKKKWRNKAFLQRYSNVIFLIFSIFAGRQIL